MYTICCEAPFPSRSTKEAWCRVGMDGLQRIGNERCATFHLNNPSYECTATGCMESHAAQDGKTFFASKSLCEDECNSYVCSQGLGCHLDQSKPDDSAQRYRSKEVCEQKCKGVQEHSYVCSPGLGCHLDQSKPDGKDRHRSQEGCEQTCAHAQKHSYECTAGIGCNVSRKNPDNNKYYRHKEDCENACNGSDRCGKESAGWCAATDSVMKHANPTVCCCKEGYHYDSVDKTCSSAPP